jgi:hypothetical protein
VTSLIAFLQNVGLKDYPDIKPYKGRRITTSLYNSREIKENVRPTQFYLDNRKLEFWDNICVNRPLELMSNRIEIINGVVRIPVVCERNSNGDLYVADGHHRLYSAMKHNVLVAITEIVDPLVVYYAKPISWDLVKPNETNTPSARAVKREYVVSDNETFSRMFYRDFQKAALELITPPVQPTETKVSTTTKRGKRNG